MTEQQRPKKAPLPLEALDDAPVAFVPPRAVNAATKPIDYAPAPPSSPPVEQPRASAPPAAVATSGTKPTPYAHETGANAPDGDAQGYGVAGFTPNYEPPEEPMVVIAPKVPFAGIGDVAREYLHMRRGKPSAWAHVVAAFLLEVALFGLGIYGLVVRLTGEPIIAGAAGGVVGAILAYAVFRDRWRCIEAYASRYAIEPPGLALLYAPFIAVVYANVRGVRKLGGK